MKLDAVIRPSTLDGRVDAPPSKSHSHRALFIGLLTGGLTRVVKPSRCTDVVASLGAVRAFGAGASVDGTIESSGLPRPPKRAVNCRRSATTMRIAMAVAALAPGRTTLLGSGSLARRPMRDGVEALRQLGVRVRSTGGLPPVVVEGGRPAGEAVRVSAGTSSQFATGLLLIAPKLGLTVEVVGDVKSRPYLEMTLEMMRRSGIEFEREGWRVEFPRQEYRPGVIGIPGDYSSAAFLLAAGALCGRVRVGGLPPPGGHPDARILEFLREAGAEVRVGDGWAEVESRGSLDGFEADLRDCPDLLPILAVVGARARGRTRIRGVEHARVKESDRISVMARELRRVGVRVTERRDGLEIEGGDGIRARTLDPEGDHRVVMALSVLALVAEGPSRVLNASVAADSYPGFFSDLFYLGGRLEVIS